MLYENDDPAIGTMLDRAILGEYDSGVVGAVCGICDESIYKGEEYFSNGEMDMCCSCYRDFVKIWD